ncbi:MAG: LptF/LptG family permease [Simkaniaceae bacterium]
MPLIWKQALRRFYQVFSLSMLSFIALLLLMRLQEILRFASIASTFRCLFLFILYQIPYILPLSIPISSLLACFLFMQNFSETSELTSLRSSGLSLFQIMHPIFFLGLFLSLINLIIVSEITPRCRFLTKDLIYKTTVKNPLLLIQKGKLMTLSNSYIDIGSVERGKLAKDVLFFMHHEKKDRSFLFTAEKLRVKKHRLKGKNVALISALEQSEKQGFDPLFIENQERMEMRSSSLTKLISVKNWMPKAEQLPFKWMVMNKNEAKTKPEKQARRFQVELSRRFAFALSAFTFIYIGLAFGIGIGRKKRKRGLFFALFLSAFLLFSFSAAKSFHQSALKASLCYFLPQVLALALSYTYLKRLERGIE